MGDSHRTTWTLSQLLLQLLAVAFASAQSAESFFPHHISDRWDYVTNGTSWGPLILTRDSIGVDRSHNLMYNGATDPTYNIDTMLSVFWLPQVASINYMYYKLGADSGNVWQNPQSAMLRWAWLARVDSELVLGRRTLVKKFRYSPGHPDSGGADYYLVEHWLAQGFGLIYKWQEPFDETYLRGCIIAGDTIGFITSVQSISQSQPAEFTLHQNYPNPFNPMTTILFTLPFDADIDIGVFNLLGQRIETLHHGRLRSGMHQVMWNASNVAGGMYLCRLHGAGDVRTIKMLLAK